MASFVPTSHDAHDSLIANEVTASSTPTGDEKNSKFTTSDDKSPSAPRNTVKNSPKKVTKAPEMTVIMQLLGPIGNMKIRHIRKTVWFWGILLGPYIRAYLPLNTASVTHVPFYLPTFHPLTLPLLLSLTLSLSLSLSLCISLSLSLYLTLSLSLSLSISLVYSSSLSFICYVLRILRHDQFLCLWIPAVGNITDVSFQMCFHRWV